MTEKIIDEVMEMIVDYGDHLELHEFYKAGYLKEAIRAKLREVLERKPLTNEKIGEILDRRDDIAERSDDGGWHILPYSFVRAIERAHNIK